MSSSLQDEFRVTRPILVPLFMAVLIFGGLALLPLALLFMQQPGFFSNPFSQAGARGFGDLVSGDSSKDSRPGTTPSTVRTGSGKDLKPSGQTHKKNGTGLPPISIKRLQRQILHMHGVHKRPKKATDGDWNDVHKEPGQSFRKWLQRNPPRLTTFRYKLIVQPIGRFSRKEHNMVVSLASLLSVYFTTTVVLKRPIRGRRLRRIQKRRHMGTLQYRTTSVMDTLLKPRLKHDTAAILGITANSLWPGNDWNFVFGEALLRERMAVMSFHHIAASRSRDGISAYDRTLIRAMKIATHEVNHLFSITHCTAWDCNMSGANSLSELDRQSFFLGPECMAKLAWLTRIPARLRYRRVCRFFKENKLLSLHKRCVQLREHLKKMDGQGGN